MSWASPSRLSTGEEGGRRALELSPTRKIHEIRERRVDFFPFFGKSGRRERITKEGNISENELTHALIHSGQSTAYGRRNQPQIIPFFPTPLRTRSCSLTRNEFRSDKRSFHSGAPGTNGSPGTVRITENNGRGCERGGANSAGGGQPISGHKTNVSPQGNQIARKERESSKPGHNYP